MLSHALALGEGLIQTLWEPPPVLELIVAFAALVTALGILWKAPLIRRPAAYVGRRLVGDPVSEWFRGLLREEATRVIKTELKEPNGGSSIPDLAAQIADVGNRIVAESSYTHHEVHRLNGWVGMMWREWAVQHGVDPDVLPEPQPSPKEN